MELRKFYSRESGKVYYVVYSPETYWKVFIETSEGFVMVEAKTAARDCGADNGEMPIRITTDREAAKEDEQVSLIGLEHPLVKQLLDEDRQLEGSARALVASQGGDTKGVLTVWHVSIQDTAERFVQRVIPIGLDTQGRRNKTIEVVATAFGNLSAATESALTPATREKLAST